MIWKNIEKLILSRPCVCAWGVSSHCLMTFAQEALPPPSL